MRVWLVLVCICGGHTSRDTPYLQAKMGLQTTSPLLFLSLSFTNSPFSAEIENVASVDEGLDKRGFFRAFAILVYEGAKKTLQY